MGLLAGYGEENFTGALYGKYSFGNQYEKLLDEPFLRENTIPIIQADLKIAGLLDDMENLDIMDVGTGRQALCFALLKAKSVHHFDISKEHVTRFSKLISSKYQDLPLTTTNIDICTDSLPSEKFDFVYLNGIAHHFSNTAVGLKNCASSVKPNGRIWVYFYRSGTFKWFVCDMIRRLLNAKDLDDSFIASSLIYSEGRLDDPVVSCIMDDFFAPYIHLYSPFEYINFMAELGFKPCASNDLDPLSAVNHNCLHHSATIVYERQEMRDVANVNTGDLLTPGAEIDQLDENLYSNDKPKRCIEAFHKVEEKVKKGVNPLMLWSLCLAMHKLAAPQYYGEYEYAIDYESLERCLTHVSENAGILN